MSQKQSRGQSQGSFRSLPQQSLAMTTKGDPSWLQSQHTLEKLSKTTQVNENDKNKIDHRKRLMYTHYNSLFDKNEEFYQGLYAQKNMCRGPNEKMILDYKKGGQSEYQKEYDEKDIKNTRVDTTYYTMQYHNKQPLDLVTQNMVNLNQKPIPKYELKSADTFKGKSDRFLPFAGISAYQDTHVKFPNNPVAMIRPAAHPTVIKDMEFSGKSFYTSSYKGDQVPYDPEIAYMINKNKRGQFKSPINPDFPFLDETSNGFYYQGYKTRRTKPFNQAKKYDPTPSFDGQYLSVKQLDFVPKNVGQLDLQSNNYSQLSKNRSQRLSHA